MECAISYVDCGEGWGSFVDWTDCLSRVNVNFYNCTCTCTMYIKVLNF